MSEDCLLKLQGSLEITCSVAAEWFMSASIVKSRENYFSRGGLGDKGTGAVYMYIKEKDVIYIGETGRTIKSRQHDERSPHKDKIWWEEWSEVRFLQIPNRTDRIILESLLILHMKPRVNTKPSYRAIEDMFKDLN